MNPYWNNTFFQFFGTFFSRLIHGFPGGLYSDELQLFVLIAIALSSALVGTFLIFRRMAMLANALSHTILAGIVVSYLVWHAYSGSQTSMEVEQFLPSDALLLVAGVGTALLTTFLTQGAILLFGISEDASTGIVFTFLFAVGIILVTSFTKNAHVGVELLMGNVDLVEMRDHVLSGWIACINVLVVALFWRPLVVTSFDPVFARVLGYAVPLFGYMLMTQVAITSVGAFRAVGVLLFLAFLVAPPLAARLWTNQCKKVLSIACAIALSTSAVGVALSRHFLSYYGIACSTGALLVTVLFLVTVVSMIARREHFPLAGRSSTVAS